MLISHRGMKLQARKDRYSDCTRLCMGCIRHRGRGMQSWMKLSPPLVSREALWSMLCTDEVTHNHTCWLECM